METEKEVQTTTRPEVLYKAKDDVLSGRAEKEEKQKSRQQEKAYHVLFQQIADHCVAHGIDIGMALEKINQYEVSITQEFVKQTWRSILKAQTGKESTKDQTKEDIKGVQPVFAELWKDITGETIDWPSVENREFDNFYNNL